MLKIQIVILVGGRGTRLGSLTDNIPKPMIKINETPFLEILINYLKFQGFNKFVLCVGYLSEKIENYFSDGSRFSVNIKYSKEELPLGTGGAILNAASMLENEFIVINGDTFLEFDYNKFINFSHQHSKICSIVGFTNHTQDIDFKNNLFIENSIVKNYSKNHFLENLNSIDAGIYFFKKEVLTYFKKPFPISLENDIFPKLIKNKEICGLLTTSRFYDIGTAKKIDRFKTFIENSKLFSKKQPFNQ